MFNIEDFFLSFKRENKKGFGLLLDLDKVNLSLIDNLINNIQKADIDFILIGSSILVNKTTKELVKKLKNHLNIPLILFPGGVSQICFEADGMLFLSLVSGRNPQYLIGEHVIAAPLIFKNNFPVIPTAYILVESGISTTVEFMSNTRPIPREKSDLAVAHALAAYYLGMKMIYLEAGSGAKYSVPEEMIKKVSMVLKDIPLMVGGGIRDKQTIKAKLEAGADFIVIGNYFEDRDKWEQLHEFTEIVHNFK